MLREAGYRFDVRPADIDEAAYPPGLTAGELVTYLAGQKAQAVAISFAGDVVLAADTVVALAGEILGKPGDRNDARQMLRRLSGTTHSVLTGVTVVRPSIGFSRSRLVESSVRMRPLSPNDIDAYLDTNNWQGKAGSYGIQDQDPFVTRITGSLTNIVGLPMEETSELLAAAGILAAK